MWKRAITAYSARISNFNLCIQCYEKVGHPHKMEKLGLLNDASSPSDNNKTNPQEARKLSIQRCIQSLVNACQCRDANCRLPSCKKMSRVVNHTRGCKRKTNGSCPICKPLIALCCYHAKNCPETKCPVPFCPNIKYMLKQQQLQQAQLLRRRIAVMSGTGTSSVMPGNNSSDISGGGGQQVGPGAARPVGGMNSGLPNQSMNIQSSHQSGLGLKPGAQTPPANVLQVVKQVQEEAARQQAPQGGQVPGQNMPPPPIRGMPGHLGANQGGNLLPMDQWQQRYPGAVRPGIRQPGMNSGGQMGGAPPNVPAGEAGQPAVQVRPVCPAVGGAVGGVMGSPAASAAIPGNVLQKQALQQLMQTLMSPQSPEQQQQILSILKANPQLMAAFIKKRQKVQQAAQMQATGGNPPEQLQHMLTQQNAAQQQQQQQQQQQHPTRMAMQGGMLSQGQPGLNQVPGGPGQPMIQQQWYKHQQLLAMQRQQQQQQQQQHQQQAAQQQQAGFQQPGGYQQQLPGIRQPHMGYNNSFNDQQYPPMQGLKPTPPPVPSPQGTMGPPQGQGISSVQQQLMQSVRSSPPIRSPQPSPSARPSPSPRNQAVASPRGPQPSPHDLASSEMLLGQNHSSLHTHASPAGGQNQESESELPAMPPQDQLSKFVEQL